MSKTRVREATRRYERAVKRVQEERYILRLYVAGATPSSQLAIKNVKALCEGRLKGRYQLQVVDIYQQPELAENLQIVAVPTLIKLMPSPLRRFIGDMSKAEQSLALGIAPKE